MLQCAPIMDLFGGLVTNMRTSHIQDPTQAALVQAEKEKNEALLIKIAALEAKCKESEEKTKRDLKEAEELERSQNKIAQLLQSTLDRVSEMESKMNGKAETKPSGPTVEETRPTAPAPPPREEQPLTPTEQEASDDDDDEWVTTPSGKRVP